MVKEGTLITMGEGRPGNPYRYYIDTMLLAMMAKDKADEEMTRWRVPTLPMCSGI
jgi:hypothetical protein